MNNEELIINRCGSMPDVPNGFLIPTEKCWTKKQGFPMMNRLFGTFDSAPRNDLQIIEMEVK